MNRNTTIAAALLGVMAVAGCSGAPESGAPEAPASTVTVTATVTETAEAAAPATVTETVTASPEPTTAAEPTTDPEVTETVTEDEPEPPEDGESAADGMVSDGTLEYRLLDVQRPDSIDSLGETEEPDGQFILVTLNVTNISDDAVDYPGWEQQLIDDQNRTHDTADSAIFVEDAFSYDTINPGLSKDGTLLFDIPADVEPTALLLHSDIFGENPVQLPLTD